MGILNSLQIYICFQLLLAVLLGAVVGVEREFMKKAAGLRTYSLVFLGLALFTIISLNAFNDFFSANRD